MEPAEYDLKLVQHSTYGKVFTLTDDDNTPIDLTSYTAEMIIKSSVDSSTPIVTLNTSNGGLVLGDALGTITLAITATATGALTFEKAWYYLEITTGTTVSRPFNGDVYNKKR